MKRLAGWVVAAVLAVAVTVSIGWLSQVPYTAETDSKALLRLSWRIRGAKVQECRALSDEERERLPPHMQLDEICGGRVSPYHLSLEVDGAQVASDTVRAAGARQDRPIYVYRDLALSPGKHSIRLVFRRLSDSAVQQSEVQGAAPAVLELESTIDLAPGAIALVTYDAERQRLVIRQDAR